MRRISSSERYDQKNQLLAKLKEQNVLVYPTDTVYGIGCDATNKEAVKHVRNAKQGPDKPMSVIAPSHEWITKHFHVDQAVQDALENLPGPYTYILRVKQRGVADNVAPEKNSVGIRRPDHWITSLVERLGKPLVTTSANISGEPTANTINDLPEAFTEHVDVAIDEGRIKGSASTIIDYSGDEPERVR